MDQNYKCFLYHCGFNYEAIKDRERNFEANGCARPAVFAWNLLPHQHLLTGLGKEMDELTWLAEVDCLFTHLKTLSFLRKEDLDWGVSLLQVDNQEATKAEIRWQADYTILWWIFWVEKDRVKKNPYQVCSSVYCVWTESCMGPLHLWPEIWWQVKAAWAPHWWLLW